MELGGTPVKGDMDARGRPAPRLLPHGDGGAPPGDIELGLGLMDTLFDVPNIRAESGEAQSHVRVGWFRSVNNVAHA
jgi:hypothetical protein